MGWIKRGGGDDGEPVQSPPGWKSYASRMQFELHEQGRVRFLLSQSSNLTRQLVLPVSVWWQLNESSGYSVIECHRHQTHCTY